MGKPLTQLVTLYLLDWLTTWLLIDLGGREGNPFLEDLNLAQLLGLKVLVALLVLSFYHLARTWTPEHYWTRLTQAGVLWFTLVNLWNVGRIGILLEASAGTIG